MKPKPFTILLVDDDPDCRSLAREALAQAYPCCDIREVANGVDALAFLHKEGPHAEAPGVDLVYLDIEMPGLLGQEVLKLIQLDPDLRSIPVIILTGLEDEALVAEAMADGASGFAQKPVESKSFANSILIAGRPWLGPVGPVGPVGLSP